MTDTDALFDYLFAGKQHKEPPVNPLHAEAERWFDLACQAGAIAEKFRVLREKRDARK